MSPFPSHLPEYNFPFLWKVFDLSLLIGFDNFTARCLRRDHLLINLGNTWAPFARLAAFCQVCTQHCQNCLCWQNTHNWLHSCMLRADACSWTFCNLPSAKWFSSFYLKDASNRFLLKTTQIINQEIKGIIMTGFISWWLHLRREQILIEGIATLLIKLQLQ